ncbi:MAG TPA: permease-like cell division protein FtsX [Candidatus Dormibacteraeota bacterium]
MGRLGVVVNGARTTRRVSTSPEPVSNGNGDIHARADDGNGAGAAAPAVRLTNVARSFGRNSVFKDVTFSVAPGELVEVVGPSGAGKTTLLRLVHGQLRPTRGEVWVGSRGLHRRWRRGLGRIRRDVAFIFQEQRLLPRLTALENVIFALMIVDAQMPMAGIKRRAREALESVGLGNRTKAYPNQLSAGERQRVAVARALATRPRVLLADEPTSALDENNARIVVRLLEAAAADGTTVIVATHTPTFHAARVLRLPAGKVFVSRTRASNGHGAAAAPLWRRLLPLNGHNGHHGRLHKRAPKAHALPLWRRSAARLANSFRLVVLGGLRSWRRDLRLTAPALGSMALLLTLSGMLALVGVAVAHVAIQEAGQASIVRFYLAADATPAAVSALESNLRADPRVKSVREVSPEEALAEARSRPGLDSLASLSATNPFPASLDVDVRNVNAIAAVAADYKDDPAADPTYPTSYDPDTYSRLRKVALVIGALGAALLLFFGIVAYAVVANSMRGVTAARKDEVTVTRLLGARGWMLRGPFVVEGLMTGALAGALAGAFAGGAWLAASRFAYATYAQVLPGVGAESVRYVVAALIVAGMVLGALTATLGFRRYRV